MKNNKKTYIETNVGIMNGKFLGIGFSSKGKIVNWYKVDDYFVALTDKNQYEESSDFDPRDDYDFVRA